MENLKREAIEFSSFAKLENPINTRCYRRYFSAAFDFARFLIEGLS